jgi:type I restriction enzyme M protein
MTELGPSLVLTEIANLAEVGVSAASNWRKRHADFPPSTVVDGQEGFAADEVARWLGQRKIARNNLHPGEAPGTTYGDRFIRNGGVPAPAASPEPPQIHAEVRPEWTSQLWQIMDLLRSDLELVSAFDFIMAMLYLRTANRELWRAVTQQPTWDAVNSMLRDAPLWEHDVPLFATATPDLSDGRQLVEAIRLFDGIALDSVGSAAMFDALVEKVNRDLGRHGGHFTPSSVIRCLVEVLDPQSTNSVYDPSCGSGELLVAAAQRGAESVFGQAMNGRSLRMTLLNLSTHDREAELRMGGPEILHDPFADKQFDVVLSNPPFSVTLPDGIERDAWPFGAPVKGAGNFAWLQIAVHKLKPGGRAAVLMPNGTLFAGGLNEEIRRKMIDAGVVEGIIALPAGLFADTGISVSLWLIRRPRPGEIAPEMLFVDATSMGTTRGRAQRVLGDDEVAKIARQYRDWHDSGRSGNIGRAAGFARSVGIEEIRRNDYDLQPRRYVRDETSSPSSSADAPFTRLETLQRELDELNEWARRTRRNVDNQLKALHDLAAGEWREASLGDLCVIQTGPGTVDRNRGLTVPGWIPLVLPRNIKRGHLSHDELDTVRPQDAAKLVSYELRPGDIVCARSGTLGRHGLVRKTEDGWLLGPSCMRLRPDGHDVVPEYLVQYLNSPEVRTWIASESRGSVIPHITASVLRELTIPLPSVAAQRDIASTIGSINAHIEQYQRGASTIQSMQDLVFPSLMKS